MSKKKNQKTPSPDEIKKAIDEVFQGAEGLKKAKGMLDGIQDKLSSFNGNFLQNDAIKKAKAKHKGSMAGLLLETLKEFEDADLSDEDIRIKIAKKFVDDYDAQVMSPIGM
jgi:hypothetical protein